MKRLLVVVAFATMFAAQNANGQTKTDKQWKALDNYIKASIEVARLTEDGETKELKEAIELLGVNEDCYFYLITDEVVDYVKKNIKAFTMEEISEKINKFMNELFSVSSLIRTKMEARLQTECVKKLDLPAAKIISGGNKSSVPLLKSANSSKVQISIGNSIRYYLLDSGSEYCIISASYFSELLEDNTLSKKNSSLKGQQLLMMANGDVINSSIYVIDGVKIGDYTLNNVAFAVIDGELGYFLAGNSLLNAFHSWQKNVKSSTLELTK